MVNDTGDFWTEIAKKNFCHLLSAVALIFGLQLSTMLTSEFWPCSSPLDFLSRSLVQKNTSVDGNWKTYILLFNVVIDGAMQWWKQFVRRVQACIVGQSVQII